MILNRAVPIVLAVFLILVFAYVALGTIYSPKCPWAFCKSPALRTAGAEAVALKYFYNGSRYHVLGKIEVPTSCTWISTTARGSSLEPLTISLTTKEATGECSKGIMLRTFYVEATGTKDAAITVFLNGKKIEATGVQVPSEVGLAY